MVFASHAGALAITEGNRWPPRRWRPLALAIALGVACLTPGPAGAEGERFWVGGLGFTAPEGWQRVAPPTPMRKAMFRVPNPTGGGDGAVTFYHFGPGRGGSVEANIERWRRQFQEPPERLGATVETKQIDGRRVHLFRAHGTLMSGAPGGPKTALPGYAFLGAVIEGQRGNVFIRFVAPGPLADASAARFRAMVESPFHR
ncbi:MAG: hypothetical protein ACE5JZ_03615 [Kiloniellales bacterium]